MLLEPQVNHSNNLLESIKSNGFAKDLSETGTGKTYSACHIARELDMPTVVICPVSVIPTWKKILSDNNVKNPILINYEKLVRGNSPYLKYDLNKFHRTNDWWKSEGHYLKFNKGSFVILDESHRCRGQKSLSSDLLVGLKNKQKKGFYKLLELSATAATSVLDMKASGYSAELHKGYNYKSWAFDHGARYNEFGTMIWEGDQTIPREGMKKIHSDLFDNYKIASRMRRTDFKGIFPDNRLCVDVFDIGNNTKKLQNIYDDMEMEIAMLDKRSSNYSNHVFAIIMKARRHAEILKIPTMVDWAIDMYDEGISPVLFVNFIDSISSIALKLASKKLKDKVAYIMGEQHPSVREAEINDFQADKKRIFVINMQAGCESIGLHDLHGNHPRASLINPSWIATNIIQACGRIPRANGKSPCIQRFFYAANTIEERMARRMENRTSNLDMLNDGDLSFGLVI